MSYAPPPSQGPYPSPYPAARPPARRPARGATVLIVVGSVLLAVAVVSGVLGVTTFLRAIPTGVVDGSGGPGSQALASGDVPGAADLTVTGGEPYSVWAVTSGAEVPFDVDDVAVTCAGTGATTVSSPSVSGNQGLGAYDAQTVAEFTAPAGGTCTVTVAGGGTAQSFVVTEGWQFGEFFATVGGTILLWFVAIGGGIVGLGLLIGGIVWRVLSRRS